MSNRTKVLYAIQGTGNGHVARARSLYAALNDAFEVDIALVGKNSDVDLPTNPVWTGRGVTMEYDRKGRVDVWRTLRANSIFRIRNEIRKIPVQDYDFIINDFESISLRAARRKNIPVIGVSHQAAVWSPDSPKTKKWMPLGRWILKHYAPVKQSIGFHFEAYNDDILPPILDENWIKQSYKGGSDVVVYLSAYGTDELEKELTGLPYRFQIFHRSVDKAYSKQNISWNPIDHDAFKLALLNSKAVLCGAGFELPSECLHHGIPLVVIPINGQFEQWCNAEALKKMGVQYLEKLDRVKATQALQNATLRPVQPQKYPNSIPPTVERIKSWWEEMRK